MKALLRSASGILALLLAAGLARGEVSLAPLFTDGAVLQRDQPVRIWGRADAGEKVTVTFGPQRHEATPGQDGVWLAILDAMPATKTRRIRTALPVTIRTTTNTASFWPK